MPVPYDFNAGDTLVSTLWQAISNLQGFMSYRASQAHANLRYYDNTGIGQGWIGKAYDDWARQFRQSQDVLNGYVYELDQHRVNTNNSLYDTELRTYKRTQRTLLTFPPPPAQPPYAPDNDSTPLHGVEGANPDCLYTYSKNTTSGSNKFSNDNLRPFFAKNLPNAAYASPADGTAPGHQSVTELAQSITRFMRFSVLELDARVAAVGEEFEAAGGGSMQFYEFSSQQALINTAQFAGQQAANTVRNLRLKTAGNPTPQEYSALLQQIAANQDDPAWTAAFFNSLSPQDLATLLHIMKAEEEPGRKALAATLAQSYVTALSSGQLNSSATSMLMDSLLGGNPYVGDVSDFNMDLLNDLQGNAQAAALFFSVASNDQLLQMLNGDYSTPGQSTSQREAQMLDLAAVAMPFTKDPDQLYNRLFPLIEKTQPADVETVVTAAQNFFGAYIAATTPPPMPGASPEALNSWAGQVSGSLNGKLSKWLSWVNQVDKANSDAQATRENIESFGIGFGVAALTILFPPASPLLALFIGAVSSAATTWPLQWADSQLFPTTGNPVIDDQNMGCGAQKAAEYAAVAVTVADGDVIGPDGEPLDPATLTDSDIQAIVANPSLYRLQSGGEYETMADLLNAVDAQFSYRTQSISTQGG